jgi:Na+/H+ antiporter NhaD/arsenite permease-like protein
VLLLVRSLTLSEAYAAIEWPILIMLGALIPVSDALRTTGGTDLIAAWLSHVASALPPFGALALLLAAAMAVTPFLNNAATVLVMAPIAASFDRPPVQHVGDGSGRLSLRRLLAAGAAAFASRARGGYAADRVLLAGLILTLLLKHFWPELCICFRPVS